MTKCLLITTRAFKSDFSSLYKQMNILKDYDEVYLVHKYKTNAIVDYIEKTAQIKITGVINIRPSYEEVISANYQTWEEVYNTFSLDLDVDDIWVFGPPLSDGARLKRKWEDTYDNIFKGKRFMNFVSIASLFHDMYYIVKIANDKGIPINEVCYDPGEASLRYFSKSPQVTTYHGYDVKHLGMKRLDSLQQGLSIKKPSLFDIEKETDFVFGYSYMNKEREQTHNEIQALYSAIDSKYTKKLFMKSKVTEEYTNIDYDAYLDEVKKSKYTLLVPAYHVNCVSCYRFIESVYNDCLPIVLHNKQNMHEFYDSFGIDAKFMERISIYNPEHTNEINDILSLDDATRKTYLDYLKEKLSI